MSHKEAAIFSKSLNYLIRTTISLPVEAIQYFASQWPEEKVKSNVDNWVFLIANNDEKVSGLVVGAPVEGGVGTIIWLLVDGNHQRKGLGALLFQETCNIYRAKGAHKIKLTVPDQRTTDFYLKQGMTLEGVHKNHWWKADFWSMGIQL